MGTRKHYSSLQGHVTLMAIVWVGIADAFVRVTLVIARGVPEVWVVPMLLAVLGVMASHMSLRRR